MEVSIGGISGTVADPRLIFIGALKAGASGMIVSHNHPSGNLTPSQADIQLTRKLKEGGNLLEIQLLDHIIMTSESYYSFADEGIL
jgi:DNA repair protein RadC